MKLHSPRCRWVFLLGISLLATTLRAQTTWVVDKSAGLGHDFTSITPAVAAASSGDTILVRPGAYSEGQLTIDKGLTMIGSLSATITLSGLGSPGMVIENIPSDEAFALHGMRVGGSILSAAILVRDCEGLVLLERLEGKLGSLGIPEQLSFQIDRCRQAHLHGVFVRGGYRVSFTDSRGVVSRSVLEGGNQVVLSAVNSHVTLDRCSISMEASLFQFSGPVGIDGGQLDITRTTITTPTIAGTGHSAISAQNNPTIRIDPTATVTSATGQPQILGQAYVSNSEIVSLTRTPSASGTVLDLQGRTGAVFVTMVSLPTAVLELPWGDVWVNLGPGQQIPIDVGVLSQRVHQATFATAGFPVGLALTVQSAVLDNALTISNGIGFVAK